MIFICIVGFEYAPYLFVMATDWECIPHFYEVHKNPLQGYITYEHPLKIHGVTIFESKGTKHYLKDIRSSLSNDNSSRASSSISLSVEPLTLSFDGTDPPSLFARQDQENMDPLTQIATEYVG